MKGKAVLRFRLRIALERLNPAPLPKAVITAVDELTRATSATSRYLRVGGSRFRGAGQAEYGVEAMSTNQEQALIIHITDVEKLLGTLRDLAAERRAQHGQ